MPSSNILVTTDFSPKSFEVITKTIDFAARYGFTLHIVHVVEKRFFGELHTIEEIKKESFAKLKARFTLLDTSHYHCEQGALSTQIEALVRKLDIKMVLLGNSGERSSMLSMFLGSSTKSIVRALHVPCLIVKSNKERLEFHKIMIPTDLSKNAQANVKNIHALFPQARIELLYSYDVPFEGRLSFYGFSQTQALSFQNEIKKEALDDATKFLAALHLGDERVSITVQNMALDASSFLEYGQNIHADLIAMHTQGNFSFLAFDLLEQSTQDILITQFK